MRRPSATASTFTSWRALQGAAKKKAGPPGVAGALSGVSGGDVSSVMVMAPDSTSNASDAERVDEALAERRARQPGRAHRVERIGAAELGGLQAEPPQRECHHDLMHGRRAKRNHDIKPDRDDRRQQFGEP